MVGMVDDSLVPRSLNQRRQHSLNSSEFVSRPVSCHRYVVI